MPAKVKKVKKLEPIIITASWLATNGACYEAVQQFQKIFGDSVELTPKVLRKADERGYCHACWMADKLLHGADSIAYSKKVGKYPATTCGEECTEILIKFLEAGKCRVT